MSTLQIRLFGRFHAQRGDCVLGDLDAKGRELLTYLLLYRDRPQSREMLAGILWGDSPTGQSRKYLRQALWQLRSTLESRSNSANHDVFLVEPDWIWLNSAADLWLDVAVFEQSFVRVQGVRGRELDADGLAALRGAVALYRGDLLEGWYQDWCLQERGRFQTMYLVMLEKLMDYCEAHHQYTQGMDYGEQILRFDHAREFAYRGLMRLHYLAGDRTTALRQYERCVSALETELDVAPSRSTRHLYEQIRADQLDNPALASHDMAIEQNARVAPLPDLLAQLKKLQRAVSDIERQLQRDIYAVEQHLNAQN